MKATPINPVKGYICVIAAAMMWASSGTAVKALMNGGMTAFELVQIRVTLSAVVLATVMGTITRAQLRISVRDIPYFFLLGGVFMGLNHGTYFYAISKIQVAAAILLQYMASIIVALFSICCWKERVRFLKVSALLLAFGGCYLVVGGYNFDLFKMNGMGILGGFGSAVFFAGYCLLGERAMHRYKPWTVLFYALLFAVPTWHILYPPFHFVKEGFTLTQWAWFFYISVIGTILPFGLFFAGINYIRSTRASITATLEPIFAGFLAFLLLGERLLLLQIIGGSMVIVAIVLLQLQQEHDELAPALIRTQKD